MLVFSHTGKIVHCKGESRYFWLMMLEGISFYVLAFGKENQISRAQKCGSKKNSLQFATRLKNAPFFVFRMTTTSQRRARQLLMLIKPFWTTSFSPRTGSSLWTTGIIIISLYINYIKSSFLGSEILYNSICRSKCAVFMSFLLRSVTVLIKNERHILIRTTRNPPEYIKTNDYYEKITVLLSSPILISWPLSTTTLYFLQLTGMPHFHSNQLIFL